MPWFFIARSIQRSHLLVERVSSIFAKSRSHAREIAQKQQCYEAKFAHSVRYRAEVFDTPIPRNFRHIVPTAFFPASPGTPPYVPCCYWLKKIDSYQISKSNISVGLSFIGIVYRTRLFFEIHHYNRATTTARCRADFSAPVAPIFLVDVIFRFSWGQIKGARAAQPSPEAPKKERKLRGTQLALSLAMPSMYVYVCSCSIPRRLVSAKGCVWVFLGIDLCSPALAYLSTKGF